MNSQNLELEHSKKIEEFKKFIGEENTTGLKYIEEIIPVIDSDQNITGFDVILSKLSLLGLYVTGTKYKILGVMSTIEGKISVFITIQKRD